MPRLEHLDAWLFAKKTGEIVGSRTGGEEQNRDRERTNKTARARLGATGAGSGRVHGRLGSALDRFQWDPCPGKSLCLSGWLTAWQPDPPKV